MAFLKKILLFKLIYTWCLAGSAQLDSIAAGDSGNARWKALMRWNAVPPVSEKSADELPWQWECLGPDAKPEELDPGGKAIPAYAANRGNGTGRINYLYIDPEDKSNLWACSPTGGLWYTRNEGKYWNDGGTDKLPVSGVSSVAVNPDRKNQWIIATGDGDDQFMFSDGVWLTRNKGKNYIQVNGSDPAAALPFAYANSPIFIGEVQCMPDNFNHVFVASSKGLWECKNIQEGISRWPFFRTKRSTSPKWKRLSEFQFYDIEIIDSPGKKRYVVAGGEKLMVSTDNGQNWQTIDAPPYSDQAKFPFVRMNPEYSEALPNFIYVMLTASEAPTQSKPGQASLFLLDLQTFVWKKIRDMEGDVTNVIPTRARAFEVDQRDQNYMLCANVQPVNISCDGGAKWKKIEKSQMHDDVHHLLFANDKTTVWASHDGGVSVSFDKGMHWETRDKGIGAANVFGVASSQTDDLLIAYGAYDTGGNILRHGKWNHVSWGDGFEAIISPSNPEIVFTTMQNGNIQATLNGKSFDQSFRSNSKTEWHTWIRMHPQDHETIYCSGANVIRSNNLGKKWEPIFQCEQVDSSLYTVYRFFLSESHPDVMYLYALDDETSVNPQLWWTQNLRESDPKRIVWKKVPYIPSEGWIVSVCVDPVSPEKFWLLYNRTETAGKIWYFNGSRYSDYTMNLAGAKCEAMIMQNDSSKRLYIGSNQGLFTKTPVEENWIRLGGLPGTYIRALDINYKTRHIIVGTFGRGIWRGPLKP
jgi:photosystem II stability/assembly factor-like uncharacterized protein